MRRSEGRMTKQARLKTGVHSSGPLVASSHGLSFSPAFPYAMYVFAFHRWQKGQDWTTSTQRTARQKPGLKIQTPPDFVWNSETSLGFRHILGKALVLGRSLASTAEEKKKDNHIMSLFLRQWWRLAVNWDTYGNKTAGGASWSCFCCSIPK